jgi:hypothetical protein
MTNRDVKQSSGMETTAPMAVAISRLLVTSPGVLDLIERAGPDAADASEVVG